MSASDFTVWAIGSVWLVAVLVGLWAWERYDATAVRVGAMFARRPMAVSAPHVLLRDLDPAVVP